MERQRGDAALDVVRDVGVYELLGTDDADVARPSPVVQADPERDGAVPAGGRETVLMPKQHAQVSAVVVGRHDESAVHVRKAARF